MSAKPPKTAIIGADGFVGSHLFDAQRRLHPDAVGTDWKRRRGLPPLDLAAPDIGGLRLAETGHTWAVIAAGAIDWALCERDKDYTRRVNVDGTLALAAQLTAAGLRVVFFSSDAVFDGRTGGYSDDAPFNPINEYGRQKLEVERCWSQATRGRGLVLRVARVVCRRIADDSLPDQICKRFVSGQIVEAARDQVFTPVPVEDIPWLIGKLQERGASGAFNVGGPEAWSRLQVALYLADALGADRSLVRDISIDEVGGGVVRPKDLSLRCDRLRALLGRELTPFSRCLEHAAAHYRKQVGGLR